MSPLQDWQPAGAPAGLVVVLPGRGYTPAMPLLDFARRVALQHGWSVREIWWDPPEGWDPDWTAAQLAAAVGDHEGPVRVIGKSLGTTAAAYAGQEGYDAVWLTPLLRLPQVAAAIRTHPGRQLLVGGTADVDAWDPVVAARLPADVLEVPGADHSMAVPDDAVRTAEIHLEVTRAVDAWFAAGRVSGSAGTA